MYRLNYIYFYDFYDCVCRNESDEGDDPEKKKFQNQLSGL